MPDLVSVDLHGTSFSYEQAHPTHSAGCTLDHLHPSVERRQQMLNLACGMYVNAGGEVEEKKTKKTATYLSKVYSLSALKK